MTTPPERIRRPPPPFRRVAVRASELLTPRMIRVTLAGEELRGFVVADLAASVRVLVPAGHELVMPEWTGNEFLLPDGSRPVIRTLTPARVDPERGELDVELVLHGAGAASTWAQTAEVGAPAAVSGPARGVAVGPDADGYLLAGDETALPAMAQLAGALPSATPARVFVEIADEVASAYPFPERDGIDVRWLVAAADARPGDAVAAAVEAAPITDGTVVWAAGEAAAVQRIRRHLFETVGVPRSRATVRGYWKFGRTAGGTDD